MTLGASTLPGQMAPMLKGPIMSDIGPLPAMVGLFQQISVEGYTTKRRLTYQRRHLPNLAARGLIITALRRAEGLRSYLYDLYVFHTPTHVCWGTCPDMR